MSMQLPPHPSLEQLKKQAKDLRKARQSGDAEATKRLRAHLPRLSDASEEEARAAEVSLQDCQHIIAREYGFESWNWLRAFVEIDLDLLLRFSDPQIRVIMCEVDNHEWMIAFNSVGDDADHPHQCSAELMAKVLGLMTKPLREHIREGIASLKPVSSTQLQEAQRHILKQADRLAAHGHISWRGGNQPDPSHGLLGEVSPFLLALVRRPVEEMSIEDIVELLVRLTIQARREGILSLRPAVEETVDPFLREALQLEMDGEKPDSVRRILEARLTRMQLAAGLEKAYRLVIIGVLSVQAGDNPVFTRRTVLEAAG